MKTATVRMMALMIGLFAVMASCRERMNSGIGDTGNHGSVVTRNIKVDQPFVGIVVDGAFSVSYQQGAVASVVAEADSATLSRLKVTVEDGRLIVGQKGTVRLFSWKTDDDSQELKVRVTSPDLTSVIIKGSGSFVAGSLIDTDNMELAVKGSGGIQLARGVLCDRLKARVQGSGDIQVKGADVLDADLGVTGSGDLEVLLKNARNTQASVTGSGEIDLTCRRCHTVDASVAGSGDISVKGTVRTVNRNTVGSGDVDCDVTRW